MARTKQTCMQPATLTKQQKRMALLEEAAKNRVDIPSQEYAILRGDEDEEEPAKKKFRKDGEKLETRSDKRESTSPIYAPSPSRSSRSDLSSDEEEQHRLEDLRPDRFYHEEDDLDFIDMLEPEIDHYENISRRQFDSDLDAEDLRFGGLSKQQFAAAFDETLLFVRKTCKAVFSDKDLRVDFDESGKTPVGLTRYIYLDTNDGEGFSQGLLDIKVKACTADGLPATQVPHSVFDIILGYALIDRYQELKGHTVKLFGPYEDNYAVQQYSIYVKPSSVADKDERHAWKNARICLATFEHMINMIYDDFKDEIKHIVQ